MTIESWKTEFYPITALAIAAGPAGDVELVEHSLDKWKGLLPENLKRHGVKLVGYGVVGRFLNKGVDIDSSSCSLCQRYASYDDDEHGNDYCGECPLYLSRGKFSCAAATNDENYSPWANFTLRDDPKPMIAALENALEWAKANESKEKETCPEENRSDTDPSI